MQSDEGMFKEDAEKLARQIQDDDPMVEILEIRLDPDLGGYVIVVNDRSADEQYVVDHYETWAEKRQEINDLDLPELVIEKVDEKHGRKVARIRGHWADVAVKELPQDVCDALASGGFPGEALVDVEPALLEVDLVEPGHGKPSEYRISGGFLVHLGPKTQKAWRRITRLANFTLEDQSDMVRDWLELGFDMDPRPQAPMVEPGRDEWDEEQVLQEVKDRLLDLGEQGFEAILVDGPTSSTAYAWVMAGVMGLKVITAWSAKGGGKTAGYTSIGYSELLHFREVEKSL